MTTEADVLAVLLGRKVFDGVQWRVFDEVGNELTALPPGAQWHGGTHGAILWGQPPGVLGGAAGGIWPRIWRDRRNR